MLSSSKGKIAMCSGDFEHLCVLWNCGALMSQIAASQMDDDEGAKEAVKNFNRAAGIYNFIKDNVAGVLNKVGSNAQFRVNNTSYVGDSDY